MNALHPGAAKVAAWRAAGAAVPELRALTRDRDVWDWCLATGWSGDEGSSRVPDQIEIVISHVGSISIESSEKGTTFKIRLPVGI